MTESFTSHEAAMAYAIRLAERGQYSTHPNPMVGCVIAKNLSLVASGWHQTAGGPHAEIHALDQAGDLAKNADAYVTLEPCSHHGRTPPCADALIAAGVARVFIAMLDPNPRVAGQGVAKLEAAGIDVQVGLCQSEAEKLNLGFVFRMTKRKPFVRLKTAATLDGKIAAKDSTSQWITGSAARADVQRLRAEASAIVTGVDTVIADNPSLTMRDEAFRASPRLAPLLRVILDSTLRTPPSAKMLHDQQGPVLIYTCNEQSSAHQRYTSEQVAVIVLPRSDISPRIVLGSMLEDLANREINSVLFECGARLATSVIAENMADELVHYVAPSFLGDAARGMITEPNGETLSDRKDFAFHEARLIGNDLRLTLRRRG